MTIKSFGKHVGFRTDTPGVLEQFLDLMPPGWERSDELAVRRLYSLRVGGEGNRKGVRRYNVLYMNAVRFERSLDFQYILDRLESDLHLYIADRAPRRIFVHAGVVAYGGKAIVLPGRTMAGKTTLVEALLRLGATYYSDEFAVLSETGRVYPYAKPLSVRPNGKEERAVAIDPSAYGAEVGTRGIPVGVVALTTYKPGVHFRPRGLHGGKAILELLRDTVPARRAPRRSLKTLERLVSSATVLKGARGEADATAEILLRRLG